MKQTIQDIYDHYTIPPQLQLHQRRVAAVGKIVAEAHAAANVNVVVTACLLHDMGNIIKFKLDRFPELLQPEGPDYWKGIQDIFKKRYGTDEHLATLIIADEVGVADDVLRCIRAVGMTYAHSNLIEGSREEQITNYADLRVGPRGCISLMERIVDGKARYGYTHDSITFTEAGFRVLCAELQSLENTLITHECEPHTLTTARIEPLAEELKTFILVK